MIRKSIGLCLMVCCALHLEAVDFSIPTVPSNIEIAEVKLRITPDAQREIQKDVNALRASEKYFNIKLDRALLYFPIIEKMLKEEGVPDDIKFLSLQESVLVSDAVSSANAVGFWQFKDFTAREVGLRVDSKIDERKNIVSSSRGAAKYMKRNNFMLKNWIYAINAYMTGPGGVKPYIDQSGIGSDKLTIDKNTHWYVKRFIAHVIAFKDDLNGIHSEGMQLITYDQGANKDLTQIARQFEVDEDLVHHYNKWLAHGKIPDDRVYAVIIPVTGKLPKVKGLEPAPVAGPAPSYPEHIAEGLTSISSNVSIDINRRETLLASNNDNLATLASKAGISVEKLKKYNDMEHHEIAGGNFYFTENKRNRNAIRYHVTQYGETLRDISQRYGVKLKKVRQKNRMDVLEEVKPGRIIWLSKTRPKNLEAEYRPVTKPVTSLSKPLEKRVTTPPVTKQEERIPLKEDVEIPSATSGEAENDAMAAGKVDVHEVVAGESLYGIAKKYDITVEDLSEWNGLERNEAIKTGQKLLVASPVEVGVNEETGPHPAKDDENVHIIAPDDTFYSISKKYKVDISDILKRNRLDQQDPIKPGQQLIIPKSKEQQTLPEVSENTYKVQAGDTFYKIARNFGLTVEELMEMNKKKNPDLTIGEDLKVRK